MSGGIQDVRAEDTTAILKPCLRSKALTIEMWWLTMSPWLQGWKESPMIPSLESALPMWQLIWQPRPRSSHGHALILKGSQVGWLPSHAILCLIKGQRKSKHVIFPKRIYQLICWSFRSVFTLWSMHDYTCFKMCLLVIYLRPVFPISSRNHCSRWEMNVRSRNETIFLSLYKLILEMALWLFEPKHYAVALIKFC